jgi:hypothetical protein
MNSENPAGERTEILGIRDVRKEHEILEVELRCGECGDLFGEAITIERLDRANKKEILQNRCRGGLHYSGFNFGEKRADTVDKLNRLCALLTSKYLGPLTEDTKRAIQELLEERNLTLRFKVRSGKRGQA